MFDSILGHETAKQTLAQALTARRLPNTLLFTGPEGIGKKKMAIALAAELLGASEVRLNAGNHPDFHLLVPEGKSGLHSIESLKNAMEIAYETPFEASAHVFIIDSAERMQPAAANALLKTLEEPTPNSYWILISAEPREILPTILSRCARVRFQPLTTEQVALLLKQTGRPESLAPVAQGSIGKALGLAEQPEGEKARALLLALLARPPAYPQLVQRLDEIEKLIDAEDPLIAHRRAEQLFEWAALYFRDQTFRETGSRTGLLFFPDAPPSALQGEWEEALEEARTGVARNLRLSACLEALVLRLQCS